MSTVSKFGVPENCIHAIMENMNIQQQIENFIPQTPAQAKAKAAMLAAWQNDGEKLLSRQAEAAHFTASAFILNPAMDKTLMVHHNIYQSFGWTGGHADGEADLLAVALREAQEDTGIQQIYPLSGAVLSLDALAVPAHQKNGKPVPTHQHYSLAFGCIAPENQPLTVKADENSAVAWLPWNQLNQYCREPHMLPIYKQIYQRMCEIARDKTAQYAKLPPALLPWYRQNARDLPWRRNREPYAVWLSEIMLQQTRVEAVRAYYLRFLDAFPTLEALAQAPEEQLLKLWEGLGYYTRARNLQKAAQIIVNEYAGQFPSEYAQIAALPGVGPYTAGAIASICFEAPTPAVDGNVVRSIARITEQFQPLGHPKNKRAIAMALAEVYPSGAFGDFTQSLMELGATICLPQNPKCPLCPAQSFCMAYRNGTVDLLPSKEKKRPRRVEERTVFLLNHAGRLALERRQNQGILAGLWQLPNLPGHLSETEALQAAANWGLKPLGIEKAVHKTHVFTHLEWKMVCYSLSCGRATTDFIWASPEELSQTYSLPTAFRIFL